MTIVEKMARAMLTKEKSMRRPCDYGDCAHAALSVVLDALREPSDALICTIKNRRFDDREPVRTFLDAIADHLAKE